MNAMLDQLVADLTPVRRVQSRDGWMLAMAVTGVAIAVVAARFGLRPDVMAGNPSGIVLLRAGALLLLGVAALAAAIDSARPSVGRRNIGWKWALAGAALFPLITLVVTMAEGGFAAGDLDPSLFAYCLGISVASAFAIGATVTWWLRRGAVTSIKLTGWLVGLAAGAFGTFAYSLHCPSTSITYIGLWYSSAIAASALIGRIAVPRLLRW